MNLWKAAILIAMLAGPVGAALTGPLAGKSEEEAVAAIDLAVAKERKSAALGRALIKALGDETAGIRIRERAAWALGELGVTTAAPALIKAADHKGLLIRSAALTSLSRLRAPSSIPVFVKIAETDPILPLRQRAIVALGAFRSEKAIEPLVQLSSDPSPELRGAAALAMAATHSKKNDFSAVLKEMAADESPYVRERAERGLEIVRGKSAAVVNQLKSGDSDVRFTAAVYFESSGGRRELDALKDAWQTEPDEDVRHQLARAIIATKKRIRAENARRAREAAARAEKAEKAKQAAPAKKP